MSRLAEKTLRKAVQQFTKPKKNGPPKIGGRSDGGRSVEAPESWRREFRIIENPVVTDAYLLEKIFGDAGHSRMSDAPERGSIRENPEVDELENEPKSKRKNKPRDAERRRQFGRRPDYGERQDEDSEKERRREPTNSTPPGFVPDIPSEPDLPWIPPGTTPAEPDFDIPEDEPEEPDEGDKERREEEFPPCEEIEEELRVALGLPALCGAGLHGAKLTTERNKSTIRHGRRR